MNPSLGGSGKVRNMRVVPDEGSVRTPMNTGEGEDAGEEEDKAQDEDICPSLGCDGGTLAWGLGKPFDTFGSAKAQLGANLELGKPFYRTPCFFT